MEVLLCKVGLFVQDNFCQAFLGLEFLGVIVIQGQDRPTFGPLGAFDQADPDAEVLLNVPEAHGGVLPPTRDFIGVLQHVADGGGRIGSVDGRGLRGVQTHPLELLEPKGEPHNKARLQVLLHVMPQRPAEGLDGLEPQEIVGLEVHVAQHAQVAQAPEVLEREAVLL